MKNFKIILEEKEKEILKLKKEIEILKKRLEEEHSNNFYLSMKADKYRQQCFDLKNTLLVEDGSAEVEKLEKLGFNVVLVRQGAQMPILLDVAYREIKQ